MFLYQILPSSVYKKHKKFIQKKINFNVEYGI